MTMKPIKIDVSSGIPMELAGVKVEFDTTDENIKRIAKFESYIDKKLKDANVKDYSDQKIAPEDVAAVLDNQGVALKVVYDDFFKEGTFDKIYANVGSSIAMRAILTTAVEKLAEYFENQAQEEVETQKEKANTYLAAKKKKNQRK
ncbi:TPA: hypothetical protein IQB69_002842 [Listeria monocytogenes]|uniref:hypothetical protein n=1 Tax=Listeria monocytogenes TaxID=1639 RepID=UPI00077AC61D|nr:hypothetical protein [Listeria monocytogenes]EAC2379272.1 hypothetical protein [Listeria monocytogenes]EAD9262729.1 hypothetical protein [Listeria monocytogenes]EAE1596979.1 hypothetical protein [Listeria monocytogenes]EAE1602419.1 hypothetical protein [Listeria monocytogenes]EAG2063996.1 hypothetical protein [Listeria monocytogenes]